MSFTASLARADAATMADGGVPPLAVQEWVLRDGVRLAVRPATTADGPALRAFVDGLSRESRYFRYLTGGRVAEPVLESFLASATDGGVAMLVLVDTDQGERIVANGQYVVNQDTAEFAVAVDDDWQGKGLGRRLIGKLRELARSAGLHRMRGDVLSENRRMLALLRDCGFHLRRNPEDSMLHLVEVALDRAEESGGARAPAAGPSLSR
ncbi:MULTISPECIES: GNAT family N-acetyltransferase [Cupriavidus]|nr:MULTISPECIES: GNAT family N-acetyltransferase [Cupriavidus]